MTPTRRAILFGATAGVGALAGLYGLTRRPRQGDLATISPPDLYDAVRAAAITLIDIRRPDEWAATGLAEGAVPIDMRRRDFAVAVQTARSNGPLPVALICARGVRSRRVSHQLTDAGVDQIVDVPEGMLGSSAGPGWIARELPVVPWTGA